MSTCEQDIQSECHDAVTQALIRVAVISCGGRVADVCSVNQGLEVLQVKSSRIKKKIIKNKIKCIPQWLGVTQFLQNTSCQEGQHNHCNTGQS